MSYLGLFKIDDILDIPGLTHTPATGAITDADGNPTWRVYKRGTAAAIRSGTLTKRDTQNGFYTGPETLSAGNGYVKGFHYLIKVEGIVGGVPGGIVHTFQIKSIADEVWDEILTGATHNINNSGGKILRNLKEASILSEGTLQGATPTTVTLNGSASGLDNFYKHTYISIVGGIGAGQSRMIENYVGSTKVATLVDVDDWVITPDNTSDYIIFGVAMTDSFEVYNVEDKTGYSLATPPPTAIQNRQEMDSNSTKLSSIETDTQNIQSRVPAALVGGRMDSNVMAINSSTDAADKLALSIGDGLVEGEIVSGFVPTTTQFKTNLSSSLDDFYNGHLLYFTDGAEKGQVFEVTDYIGATKVITITSSTGMPSVGDKFILG